MFVDLGQNVIEVKMESSVTLTFFYRRGVGRMSHMDTRVLWLQDRIAAGDVRLIEISRAQNLADMLTHASSAKELEVFLQLMGFRYCSDREKSLVVTK